MSHVTTKSPFKTKPTFKNIAVCVWFNGWNIKKKAFNWTKLCYIKGIYNPQYLPNDFFCSIYFLGWFEAFSPQLVDSNMPLDPWNRDRISLNIGLCFVILPVLVQGKSLLRFKKGRFLYRNVLKRNSFIQSDFPCAREITLGSPKGAFPYRNVLKTSSIGLKCKQKHDLLLGVVYPFKIFIEIHDICSKLS